MGKKRKRNTNAAGGEGAADKNLSYSEIWDDSALIDSWNDAVEEYKVRPLSQSCHPDEHILCEGEENVSLIRALSK